MCVARLKAASGVPRCMGEREGLMLGKGDSHSWPMTVRLSSERER